MKLATAEEMRLIDKEALEVYGLPELVLMENAGHRVAEAAAEMLQGAEDKSLVVLAGCGNNGGDALAAARHLLNMGARVKVFLTGNLDKLKPSAKTMYEILQNMEAEIHGLEGGRDWDRLHLALKFAVGAVDGLLGTGFHGELRKEALRVIEEVNAARLPVLAIDVPSGVEADTGLVSTVAVQAQVTVALGLPKPGHFFSPGADCTGRLLVDDIGLPRKLLDKDSLQMQLLDDKLALGLLPPRPRSAHKGSCGKVLVVAGSKGMTGAASLAARSALRIGAGLVTLAVPESVQPVLASQLAEIMVQPLPERSKAAAAAEGLPEQYDDIGPEGTLGGDAALARLLEMSRQADAVLLGPGLGRARETQELVRRFVQEAECPLILDADAIYAFGGNPDALSQCHQMPVLTPHMGEMARLLGVTVEELRESLLPMVSEAAREYQAVFVVKSECTVIAYPDGDLFFTTKGNAGMATAGSGDVLAGTVAGLAKQTETGLAPLLGVYLHGLAGDLAYVRWCEGLIAGDIVDMLPQARRELKECQRSAGDSGSGGAVHLTTALPSQNGLEKPWLDKFTLQD